MPTLERSRLVLNYCLFVGMTVASSSVAASSFTSFDAPSLAMGGVGVASARPDKGMYFNPSLLSLKRDGAKDSLLMSIHAGARLVDRDDFIAGVRHFQHNDADEYFKTALAAFNDKSNRQELTPEDFDLLTTATNNFLDDIEGLSNRPLRAGAAIGVSIAKPGHTGFGGFVRSYAIGGGTVHFAAEDGELVSSILDFGRSTLSLGAQFDDYVTFLRNNATFLESSYAAGGIDQLDMDLRGLLATSEFAENADAFASILHAYHDAYIAGETRIESIESFFALPNIDENLKSSIELSGSEITEYGISISRRLSGRRRISIGTSLKRIEFDTFDYSGPVNATESESLSSRDYRRQYNDLNIDFGISVPANEHIRWGLAARNLVSRRYKTVRGNVIKIEPLARAGVVWTNDRLKIAADLDLTRNDPLGFDDDKRFLAVGLERRWAHWIVRSGIRRNLIDDEQLYSAGTALKLGRATIQFSVAHARDTIASALQLDWQF